MLNFAFIIISSFLLSSALSKLSSELSVKLLSIKLVSEYYLDSLSVIAKTKDLLEFPLFFIFFSLFALSLYLVNKKSSLTYSTKTTILVIYSIFSIMIYLQTFFVNHSITQTLLTIMVPTSITLLSFKFFPNYEVKNSSKIVIVNGILLGFYLAILARNFTSSFAIPMFLFLSTPLYFLIFSQYLKDKLSQPTFLLLLICVFFPYQKITLIILAFTVIILLTLPLNLKFRYQKAFTLISILILLLYNPLFYFGSYDSIEEGFWAAWLQRVLQGEVIYRDFAAHQPPILLWGLEAFNKILGPSLYNIRLYFHLLSILGMLVIFFSLNLILKNVWVKLGIFILIVSFTSIELRNNMEIRLASGLLPFLFLAQYFHTKIWRFLVLAFALASLAIFISIEVGIASLISVSVCTLFSINKKEIIKVAYSFCLGTLIGAIVPLVILLANNSLSKFVEYMVFYSSALSSGYLNIPLQKPEIRPLLQWSEVIKFINSIGFLWELIKFTLGATFLVLLVQKINKTLSNTDYLLIGLSFFILILARSALGRSDSYHIAYIWVIGLFLIGYLIEKISRVYKTTAILIFTVLLFLISFNNFNLNLIQKQLIKLQAYGNPSGNYPQYQTERAKILPNVDTNPRHTDDLINYIRENTKRNDKIFVFPLSPEIYFLADRSNPTSFDLLGSFGTEKYQNQIITELEYNPPKIVVYNRNIQLKGFTDNLSRINSYILQNYVTGSKFGSFDILIPKYLNQ